VCGGHNTVNVVWLWSSSGWKAS